MATVAMAMGAQVTALAVVVAIKGAVEEDAAAMAARGVAEWAVTVVVVATITVAGAPTSVGTT